MAHLLIQVNMLTAALAGGVIAMIIGKIGIAQVNTIMMKTIPKITF